MCAAYIVNCLARNLTSNKNQLIYYVNIYLWSTEDKSEPPKNHRYNHRKMLCLIYTGKMRTNISQKTMLFNEWEITPVWNQ
jgi:hypothetical protein